MDFCLEILRIKKEEKRPDLAMHLRQFRLQYIPEMSKAGKSSFDYSFRKISAEVQKAEIRIRNSTNKDRVGTLGMLKLNKDLVWMDWRRNSNS